ncbi:MAG: DUF2520 domain-containing protein [Desulfobacterium sp.]|nr:DUF2520 domain-containing protein [Desulfobacterium sp.]MBU3946618.1 DUF2520 domain-containing protein [Pseudomonadota bacterium]MBU4010011.1 DUF2520 domain-containing protein [Pseudomonadota bacterium]
MKPSFSIVGCGRVGTALAKFLSKVGYIPTGFASKSLSSAKRAAALIGSTNFTDVLWEATKKADIVFITTPDGAIEEVCKSIADKNGFNSDSIVLHCSGALTSEILLSAKTCGASIGSLHPLQSFASTTEYNINPFSGIVTSVEGDKKAVDAAKLIVEDLDSVCISIKTDTKILYHASAVVASNYLVTLLDLSLNLICQAGVPAKDAFKGLKPLIEGTLSNIENMSIPDALTGPIARGDVQTIENHLSEIGSKTPNLLPLYKTLGLHTIEIAKAKKTITDSTAKRLKELFGDSISQK